MVNDSSFTRRISPNFNNHFYDKQLKLSDIKQNKVIKTDKFI